MKDIRIERSRTVAEYNARQICVTQILTGKEFRRKKRKKTIKNS